MFRFYLWGLSYLQGLGDWKIFGLLLEPVSWSFLKPGSVLTNTDLQSLKVNDFSLCFPTYERLLTVITQSFSENFSEN